MNKSQKILILTFSFITLVMTGATFFLFKNRFAFLFLPPAQTYHSVANPLAIEQPLPEEINLKIPFTSQAPHKNWSHPYKEFCEEASALMAASYVNSQSILGPDDADAKLLAIEAFEEKRFGSFEDTSAEDTAIILREYFKIENVKVIYSPKAEDIKKALVNGKAVIAPLAGREIGNPYYLQPGPLYHMLVIKGYRKNGDFITNDPGTKRGADFIYPEKILMDALADWKNNDLDRSTKAIIIVG